ncbi:serine protease hepsin [Paramormyrops kingsleyae]|uniref:Hepsin n=1 Tax=Paramormyrops kingsleyae TaxID=1676925 RepID=A0A3B3RVD2_9TELE|nr:serine protease hepsin [Paramormyrops kingsleyae]XP_023656901.1 serine protease hepsin [Paramormyrops kingsleyae]
MSEKNNGSQGISFLTPCRVITSFLILFLLVGIGAAAWAVVTFLIKQEETGLYDVQVNSVDQRLSVFDRMQGRWRSVCSSSSNELLANISCEEMGFVRALNHSVYSILNGINNSEDFFCVGVEELTYGKKFRELLFPCNCDSGLILRVQCQDCGRRSLTEDRIVGGLDARQGSWPWQVSLQYDGVHQCGGSIISDRWIVSAAHCFPERYRHVARWRVLLGSIYKAHTHSSVHTAEVQTVVFHSSYLPFVDPNVDDNSRDIAVLALTSRLQFTEYIQPVCLPTYGQRLIDGQMGTVTGWGNTEYYGQPSDVLQEASVPIISDAVCNAADYYDNQITTSMFCAGYEKGGTDACQGDSGGPFVSEDSLSKASRYRLLGVVSWGTGCAMAKKPGVYTKVSRFLPWISSAMRTFENVPGVHKMSRT